MDSRVIPAFALTIASLITLFAAPGWFFSFIYIYICFLPLTSNSRVQRPMVAVTSDSVYQTRSKARIGHSMYKQFRQIPRVCKKSSYGISLGVQSTASRISIRCRKATSKKLRRHGGVGVFLLISICTQSLGPCL